MGYLWKKATESQFSNQEKWILLGKREWKWRKGLKKGWSNGVDMSDILIILQMEKWESLCSLFDVLLDACTRWQEWLCIGTFGKRPGCQYTRLEMGDGGSGTGGGACVASASTVFLNGSGDGNSWVSWFCGVRWNSGQISSSSLFF